MWGKVSLSKVRAKAEEVDRVGTDSGRDIESSDGVILGPETVEETTYWNQLVPKERRNKS